MEAEARLPGAWTPEIGALGAVLRAMTVGRHQGDHPATTGVLPQEDRPEMTVARCLEALPEMIAEIGDHRGIWMMGRP